MNIQLFACSNGVILHFEYIFSIVNRLCKQSFLASPASLSPTASHRDLSLDQQWPTAIHLGLEK